MSEDGHQQGMDEHRRHVKVPLALAAAAACRSLLLPALRHHVML